MIELPRAALHGRRDRRDGRVLQLRHQRPDADDLRHQPRRRRQLPAGLSADKDPASRPVRDASTSIGVGELVKIAAERGRATRPDIKLGICGEHGGDPASVHFCHKSASTTSPARPTAFRSPVWPQRRPRCPASRWSGIEPLPPDPDQGTWRKAVDRGARR